MKVPILMYHSVGGEETVKNNPPSLRPVGYRISRELFIAQLEYLRDGNRTPITLGEFLAWQKRERKLPPRPLILSFDDGYIDNHRVVLPLLTEFGFRAVFFITAGALGGEGMMGGEETAELAAAGMEIGSHGINHEILAGVSEKNLLNELSGSRKILSETVGIEIDYFSIPRGFRPPRLTELARRAGYRGACTSRPGYNSSATDPFALRRWPLRTGMDGNDFRALVEGRGVRFIKINIQEKIRFLLRARFRLRPKKTVSGQGKI